MKPWFNVHRFWGWYPTTLEGYFVIALMTVGVITAVIIGTLDTNSTVQILITSFPLVSFLVTLTMLIIQQTGAKPAFNDTSAHNFSPDNPRVYIALPILILISATYYVLIGSWVQSIILAVTCLFLLRFYQVLISENNNVRG